MSCERLGGIRSVRFAALARLRFQRNRRRELFAKEPRSGGRVLRYASSFREALSSRGGPTKDPRLLASERDSDPAHTRTTMHPTKKEFMRKSATAARLLSDGFSSSLSLKSPTSERSEADGTISLRGFGMTI